MRKYSSDKHITSFLLSFMRLMGNHMEELGVAEDNRHRVQQEEEAKRQAEHNKPRQADPAQVQRWMSDPANTGQPAKHRHQHDSKTTHGH